MWTRVALATEYCPSNGITPGTKLRKMNAGKPQMTAQTAKLLILNPYKHRIQITYRMFTPIGANGKLLTLNFHIDTGAATNGQNN